MSRFLDTQVSSEKEEFNYLNKLTIFTAKISQSEASLQEERL